MHVIHCHVFSLTRGDAAEMVSLSKCQVIIVMLSVIDDTGEYVANDKRSSQSCMIEHVVIYQFDASSESELSLAVDDRVWVSLIITVRASYRFAAESASERIV